MKKLLAVVALLVFALGALTLVSCSSEQDEAVVGTWNLEGLDSYRYVFNEDGTGSRGGGIFEVETFRWSTSGDRLNINRDEAARGEIRNERWTYSISGNTLTIDSQQESGLVFRLSRAD